MLVSLIYDTLIKPILNKSDVTTAKLPLTLTANLTLKHLFYCYNDT